MAVLAEAYIRLSPFYVSEEELRRLGRATDEIARAAALRIFTQPVEIEVELIEGTLKGKIRATGLFVAGAVGIYASIGGAIDTTEKFCKISRTFSEYVCDQFVKKSGATREQVQRIEKRTGAPGKILRALKRIESLNKHAPSMTKAQIELELQKATVQLDAALKDFSPDEAKAFQQFKVIALPPHKSDEQDKQVVEMPRVAEMVGVRQVAATQNHSPIAPPQEHIRPHRTPRRYHNVFSVLPVENRGDDDIKTSSLGGIEEAH
ncbi:MAG TPA: hypothetical protein VGU01_06850 [Sphingomicrobium sp.]|nr:hypothetical protein [Sphingomicrobium sp.]